MQMTSLSFRKMLAGCALGGVLAAGIWSVTLPNLYVSTAVLRFGSTTPGTGHGRRLAAGSVQAALSRASLSSIILQQNLYAKDRLRYPMEEIAQRMRNRHLRIQPLNADGTALAVSFENENPVAAQATVRAIASALSRQNSQVLDPASLPSRPMSPNRMLVIGGGLGAGLALGLLCGALWWTVRRNGRGKLLRIGGFAAAGMAIGLAVAFLIPSEYVSTAVVRARDGGEPQSRLAQVLSDDSLTAIARENRLFSRELSRSSVKDVARKMRSENIHVQAVQLVPGAEGAAFSISFTYPDRLAAKSVTRDLVNRLITGSGAPLTATEVLDSASLPETPIYPNRLSIAALGTLVGIMSGFGAGRMRRKRVATA
jgi:uncharacterized protein involved in exopolysaccharide biosynthesis